MITPGTTRVPDVVDALLVLAGRIDDCKVEDGPAFKVTKGTTIAIGVGEPAVIATKELLEGLAIRYRETVSVTCNLWSWSGGSKVKPHRDRCKEVLDALKAQLDEDSTLGGVCDRVNLGQQFAWLPESDKDGVSVTVGFTIDAMAMI